MEWNQAIRLVSVGGRVDPKPKAGIKPGPHKEGPVLGKARVLLQSQSICWWGREPD